MAMNSENNIEESEMTECDGEKVVTMMDVLQEQEEFEEDANAVLGASDDMNCTFSKGYIKRQAIYACLTCCDEARHDDTKRAGVCLACSLSCHENHDLIELYTKRNFRCDCGNPKFNSHPCQFTPNKTELNTENNYNQNFSGIYCVCHRPYPDPEGNEEEEMIQCIICEDWLHSTHLEAGVPPNDQYSEMVCKDCMEKNEFLHDYSHLAVNIEMGDVDIIHVNGNDSLCNGKADGNLTNGDVTEETIEKNITDMETETNLTKDNNDYKETDNKEPTTIDRDSKIENESENSEKMETDVSDPPIKNKNQQESEIDTPEEAKIPDPEIKEPELKKDIDKENVNLESKTDNVVVDSNKVVENTTTELNKSDNSEVVPDKQETVTNSTVDNDIINTETEEVKECTKKELNKSDNGEFETKTQENNTPDTNNDTETEEVKVEVKLSPTEKNETDSTETSDNPEYNENKISEATPVIAMDIDSEVNKTSVADANITNDKTDDVNTKEILEKIVTENDNTENKESTSAGENETKEETTPDSIANDKSGEITQNDNTTSKNEQNSTNNDNSLTTGSLNNSNKIDEDKEVGPVSNTTDKRKLDDDINNSNIKKPKLDTCTRPRNVKRIYKGATFWPSYFRQKLCTCNDCITMYKDLSVLFLTDPEDTVSAYETLGKEINDGEPSTQYEKGLKALSSLNRVQQINALTEYNKMRDKLLDFLKSFKDKKEVVKEEDIRAFFAGMKPKREPDGVYFCR